MTTQLSVVLQIDGPSVSGPGSAVGSAIVGSPHADGWRLCGFWPDTPLDTARLEFAEALEAYPADTRVNDAFTGAEAALSEVLEALRAAPTVDRCFVIRQTVWSGRTWLRLMGMPKVGRADLVLGLAPDVEPSAAWDFLSRLGAMALSDSAPPPEDRPLPFGYWLVGLGSAGLADDGAWDALRAGWGSGFLQHAYDDRMVAPAPQIVIEAEDAADTETRWLIGADRALRTFAAQARARARFGLGRVGALPNAHDAAIVCARLADAAAEGCFAYREPAQGPIDSGWRFACMDPTHVHDEGAMRITTLGQVPHRDPAFVSYLGLPEGWVVSRDGEGFWVKPADQDESLLDVGAEAGAPWDAPEPLA